MYDRLPSGGLSELARRNGPTGENAAGLLLYRDGRGMTRHGLPCPLAFNGPGPALVAIMLAWLSHAGAVVVSRRSRCAALYSCRAQLAVLA